MPLERIKGLRERMLVIVLLAILPVLFLALFLAIQDYREAKATAIENCKSFARLYATTASNSGLLERSRMLLKDLAALPGIANLEPESVGRVLASLDTTSGSFNHVAVLRPDGTVVGCTNPAHIHVRSSGAEWFRSALASQDIVLGSFQTGPDGRRELPMALAVHRPGGGVRLVLTVGIRLESLAEFLDDFALPEGAAVSIIDRSGTILARYPSTGKQVGHEAPEAASFLPELLAKGQDSWQSQGVDGVERIYFLAPLFGRQDRSLFLRMGLPASTAFAQANRNLTRNLTFLGVMAAFVLAATWIFSNSLVVRHIRNIWLATRKLADGNYAYRIGATGGGELGELALAFDHMAGVLEHRTAQLTEAERNYRHIFENSISGIFQTSLDGRILIANQAMADLLGYQDPQELMDSVRDVTRDLYLDPETRRSVLNELELAGSVSSVEFPVRRTDGRLVWLNLDARALRDEHGRLVGVEGMATDVTLRKLVEQELKSKQEKLQGLLDNSPALISIKDAHGRYVLSNRMHQMTYNNGVPVQGRSVGDLFGPDEARLILEEDRLVLAEGKSLSFQRMLPTKNGPRHFMSVKFPLFDDEGRPDRVCSISYDVSDLELVREALRQSEEKYRTMIQTSPDLIWLIDPQGMLVEVNHASRELIGYEPEELRGKHFAQFFHPDDAHAHDRDVVLPQYVGRRTGASGQPKLINERRQPPRSTRNLNLRLVPKGEASGDSDERNFELSACGLWQNMRFLGTIVVIRDITERRRTETALRQSQDLLSQTQAMARIGGWSANLDTREVTWTEETDRLFNLGGRPLPDHRDGMDALFFIASEDRPLLAAALERSEESCESFDLEVRLTQAGTAQRWVRIKAMRVDTAEARVLSGMVQDITDRKHLELLRNDIDNIIRHDLKTPLNGIINLPQVMRGDANLTPDQVELLGLIEDSGRNMLRQIDMSLDLLKIERGQFELNAAGFDILPLLREIQAALGGYAARRQLRLETGVEGGPVRPESVFRVHGEERLCYPILSNLLLNALEASPQGAAVQVAFVAAGAEARISIRNEGEIPVEIRPRFFEKYVTSGKAKGTGLGTYSAQLFARAQGGRVDLDASEPGATTLVVRLPLG